MQELKKNKEGYYDPTAYQAIKKVWKEENNMSFKRGEIYEYEMSNGTTKYALIVSAGNRKSDTVQSIVVLNEDGKGNNPVPIKVTGMQHADCDRISYAAKERLLSFVRTATDEEMDQIDQALKNALGLHDSPSLQDIEKDALIERLQSENRRLENENEYMKKDIEDLNKDLKVFHKRCRLLEQEPVFPEDYDPHEVTVLTTQRDMYKQQYEMLLDRMIAR